jgi:2-methylcitrate dehydratase PrpD
MNQPLARQIANWTASVQYKDLDAQVIDKVKALFLHGLSGMAIGLRSRHARDVVTSMLDEEASPNGCSVFGFPEKATRVAAAFSMSELIHASGLWDSYRMLTHPGAVLIPAALLTAEKEDSSGKEILAALAAGYEVLCRLCDDFIPSTAAQGFRPSPIYSTIAGAVVAAKLMRLNSDQILNAIGLAANFASGLNEGPRRGTGEMAIHEPQAARNAVFAAMMARQDHVQCADTSLDGRAGFYNAFTGSHSGDLTYSFKNADSVDMSSITQNLGSVWKLNTLMFRIYACPGYNQAVIELLSDLHHEHQLSSDKIEKINVHMNWIETQYPSPAFPLYEDWDAPRRTETHFFAAYAAAHGRFPTAGEMTDSDTKSSVNNDVQAHALMKRVSLIPEKDRAMFSPEVSILLSSGEQIRGSYPYSNMEWTFDQLTPRLQPGFTAKASTMLEQLITFSAELDSRNSLEGLAAIFGDCRSS